MEIPVAKIAFMSSHYNVDALCVGLQLDFGVKQLGADLALKAQSLVVHPLDVGFQHRLAEVAAADGARRAHALRPAAMVVLLLTTQHRLRATRTRVLFVGMFLRLMLFVFRARNRLLAQTAGDEF